MNIDGGRLGFKITIDDSEINDALRKVEQSIIGFADTAEKEGESIRKVFDSVVESMSDNRAANVLNSVSDAYKEMLEDAIQVYGELDPATNRYYERLGLLEQETKSLATAQHQLSESYERGEITQRQYRNASQALVIQQKEAERLISEINGELERNEAIERANIGSIAGKTARLTQLRHQYERLSQAQRDHAEVGGKIRAEYKRLTKEVNELNASLSGTRSGGIGEVFRSIQGIAGAVGVAFGAYQLVQFGKELFEIAKQAQGVELAFARMADPAALDKLRESTRGTVADLELMRLAVRADNFRIPMDTLAKGLEFARRRAVDTGQDVDYMVNSFVDGVGRKSTLVLDNLGISLVEIQDEVKKVGDFNVAVGNIIEREMERAGYSVDTLADKTNRLAASWQNFKRWLSRFGSADLSPDAASISGIVSADFDQNFLTAGDSYRNIAIRIQERTLREAKREFDEANRLLKDASSDAEKSGLVATYQKRVREAANNLEAQQKILNTYRQQTEELKAQERHAEGIFSVEELKGKISELTAYRDKLTDPEKIRATNKELEALAKQMAELTGSASRSREASSAKALEAETKERRKILDQWIALDTEYLTKALSRDDQEIQSVRNKYDAFRKVAEEFNANARGERISLEGLDESEQQAIDAVRYRQETASLVAQLGAQREAWEQYEAFKTDVSKEQADIRFADELENIASFRRRLEEAVSSLTMQQITVGLSGGEEERLKALDALLRDIEGKEQARTDERLRRALAEYASYEQKRKRIIADAEKDIAELRAKGLDEQAEIVRKARDKELTELYRAEIEGSAEFKDLERQMNKSGSAMALSALKHGKATILNMVKGIKDEAQRASLEKLFGDWFDEAIESAEQKNFGNVVQLVEGFDRLVQSAQQFDGTMSGALKTIGRMVSQVGQLAKTLGQTFQDVGGGMSKAGGWGAIVGAALSLVGSVVQAIESADRKREAERREQLQYSTDFQIRQMDAITRMLEFQLSLIEDMYGVDRVQSYAKAAMDAAEAFENSFLSEPGGAGRGGTDSGRRTNMLAGRVLLVGDKDLDERIARLNNYTAAGTKGANEMQRSWNNLIRDIEAGGYPVERLAFGFKSIADMTFEDVRMLTELVESGRLDEKTEAMVSNMIRQHEIWREATNRMNEELTGTTFEALLADTSRLFFNAGEDSAEAWAKGFDKILENYLIQTFSREFLEGRMQSFYDLYTELAKDGFTEDEKDELRRDWDSIREDGNQFRDDLRDMLGFDASSGRQQGELSRGIAGITETTANRLEAEFGGLRLAQLQLLEVSRTHYHNSDQAIRDKLAILASINTNTGRTADNTNRTAINTERLANIETAIVSLNNKVSNTDSLLRGAGLR